MSLETALGQRLDAGAILGELGSSGTAALAAMDAVALPDTGADLAGMQNLADAIDLSSIGNALQGTVAELDGLLENLPLPGDALESVQGALDLAHRLGDLDVPEALGELSAQIESGLSGSGDYLDQLNRLAGLLAGNASVGDARDLLAALARLLGGDLDSGLSRLPELLPTVTTTLQAVGSLMTLHTTLAEGHRLASVVAGQLDPGSVNGALDLVERQLQPLGGSLAVLIASVNSSNAAEVAAVKQAIQNTAAAVAALSDTVAEGMAFGEATLVHLDASGLTRGVEQIALQLGALDFTPLHSSAEALAGHLRSLLVLDVSAAPASTLDGWLVQLETRSATLAATIDGFDVTALSAPVSQGLNTVLALPQALTAALEEVRVSLQQALAGVQQGVQAIPLDTVANTIRRALQPVLDALEFIEQLVARIEAAMGVAVDALQGALDGSEAAVDTVRQQLENLFGEARDFITELDLEATVGVISGEIRAFSETLASADMSPYFDTVAGAVSSAADVVEQVPFGLLPDSMEQEVVDVVRPVKQTDLEALRARILALLQVDEDGNFTLRPELEEALAGIQSKYEALLARVSEHDPRALLEPLDAELSQLQARIAQLLPEVALEPVSAAIESVRSLLSEFDAESLLQPLRDGFDQLLAGIDQFRPGILLEPLETQLAEARSAIFDTLPIAGWGEQVERMRTQTLALFEPLDPNQLQPQLEALVADLRSQVDGLAGTDLGFAFGSLMSALLGGGRQPGADSMQVLLQWLRGESGGTAMAAVAAETAGLIDQAREGVEQVDPQAIVLRLQPSLDAVRQAAAGLPPGPVRDQLVECARALDIDARLQGFGASRNRYVSTLRSASSELTVLAATGLSTVDVTVAGLRNALSPLAPLRDFGKQMLDLLGLENPAAGLHSLLLDILEVASPERLSAILGPILMALKGRLQELLDSVFEPLLAAIADLQALPGQLSLAGLIAELDTIHAAVRGQIAQLHPDQVLGDALTELTGLQARVAAFDPLAPLNEALTALRDSSSRVLGKLDAEDILATPLAVYDKILADLGQLDLQRILVPLLDTLDALAAGVEQGLEDTTTAFQRLQAALPDQIGSTTVSGSASL